MNTPDAASVPATVDLAVRRYGHGRPLVLLHGLFGSASHWHHVAVRLAERHEVLAIDLRNHGASPRATAMDYPTLARDVIRVLDKLDLDDAVVLGHSMGGKVAMAMALMGAPRLRRLVVVDIAPVAYPDTFSPLIDAALALDLAGLQDRAAADRQLVPALPSPQARATVLHNLVRRRDGAWAWRVAWPPIAAQLDVLRAFPFETGRHACDRPALFVRGGRSDFVRAEHGAAIRGLFPRASMHLIEDAGHWVQADRPAALVWAVQAWVA